MIFRIRTEKCMKLFTENITYYFAHVQTVCTRSLLRGEGPRDEASEKDTRPSPRFTVLEATKSWVGPRKEAKLCTCKLPPDSQLASLLMLWFLCSDKFAFNTCNYW